MRSVYQLKKNAKTKEESFSLLRTSNWKCHTLPQLSTKCGNATLCHNVCFATSVSRKDRTGKPHQPQAAGPSSPWLPSTSCRWKPFRDPADQGSLPTKTVLAAGHTHPFPGMLCLNSCLAGEALLTLKANACEGLKGAWRGCRLQPNLRQPA